MKQTERAVEIAIEEEEKPMPKLIKLTKAQKVWLKEIHEKGNNFFPASARARLRNKLGKGFRVNSIPHLCLYSPKRLSLIGIREIEPDSQTLKDADSVIRCIKKHIESGKDPIPDLQVDAIVKQTKIDKRQILICLSLIERVDFRTLGSMDFLDRETGEPRNQEQNITFERKGERYSSLENVNADAHSLDSFLEYQNLNASLDKYISVIPSRPAGPYTGSPDQKEPTKSQGEIKENRAFVMMRIDPENSDVQAIKQAIKETCKRFGIEAKTVDEIEHQEKISDVITREIKDCRYLIADLTGERPNVYYEVGYAHALDKSPGVILFNKQGEDAHFDISHHKISEYKTTQNLQTILTKRLGDITGKKPVKGQGKHQ